MQIVEIINYLSYISRRILRKVLLWYGPAFWGPTDAGSYTNAFQNSLNPAGHLPTLTHILPLLRIP
jgi:hypothetical protein